MWALKFNEYGLGRLSFKIREGNWENLMNIFLKICEICSGGIREAR